MPELPEIETVKRGIKSLENQIISDIVIRNNKLRYTVDNNLSQILKHATIIEITRRAKYLILKLATKTKTSSKDSYLIIHLGMSGSVGLIDNNVTLKKHDHVDILFENGVILRYNDPRRFGCILYTDSLDNHSLLKHLGPEPLDSEFNPEYLYNKIKNRTSTIKQLIMDNAIVVGVGNIYACEALFLSRISPLRLGKNITKDQIETLVESIKQVLSKAIELGGSTLRDYKKADGSLGYFQNIHYVYGRSGKNCKICNHEIVEKRLGQRNSFYCIQCQK